MRVSSTGQQSSKIMAFQRTLRRCSRITNYDTFLSTRSKARRPSAIRALQPLLSEPGMISLGGGMPNPTTFPIQSIKVTLSNDNDDVEPSTFTLENQSLDDVLQYSGTRGTIPLLQHLNELQSNEHGNIQPKPFEICVTTGSQDALSKAFDLFTGKNHFFLFQCMYYTIPNTKCYIYFNQPMNFFFVFLFFTTNPNP